MRVLPSLTMLLALAGAAPLQAAACNQTVSRRCAEPIVVTGPGVGAYPPGTVIVTRPGWSQYQYQPAYPPAQVVVVQPACPPPPQVVVIQPACPPPQVVLIQPACPSPRWDDSWGCRRPRWDQRGGWELSVGGRW